MPAPKLIGNYGRGFRSNSGGLSTAQGLNPNLSQMAMVGVTGDIGYATFSELVSNGKFYQGLSIQSDCGATVDFTLATFDQIHSTDANVRAAVKWGNTLTLAASGEIQFAQFAFTGVRVTFTGAGAVYLAAS